MDLPLAGAAGRAPADEPALLPTQRNEWDALVEANELVLFMKGTPGSPRCGFSARAAGVLDRLGRPYAHVDVFATEDPARTMLALREWAQFPTLPQVWVKGELIGGSDIAADMYDSGELQQMLE